MLHVDEAVAEQLTNDPTTRTVRIDANIDGDDLETSLLEGGNTNYTISGNSEHSGNIEKIKYQIKFLHWK